jgi:amino acid transporter
MSAIHFKKNISLFSLIMTGLTSIVGSGWLLGTQKIAEVTGPASILAWVVGALVALIVGLFYVEIGSAFPSAGGIGYYSNLTHGRFCGFLTSWINWLSIVAVPPIEAQGVIQYLSQINNKFMLLYTPGTHNLTSTGIAAAIGLMLLFMFINYWSVRLFIRFNNVFTVIKMVVPILTIICLVYTGLHPSNFGTTAATFMPYGYKSVLISVITCGVIMSFNGFQAPLTFSEEISNPKRMLPIAIAASILIALVLYVLLQIVFIGSVDPTLIAQGWSHVNFRSPYIDLLMLANFQIMITVIYAGSVISPGVCGAAFVASGARIMYSLAQQRHLPQVLAQIHPIYKNPRNAIVACALIGCIFLFLFKGWYELVAVISVLHVFSYLAAPIITIANRTKNKEIMGDKKQFKLFGAYFLAPFIMFILSILLFYAAWPLTGEMLVLIVPGLALYFYYDAKYYKDQKFYAAFKGASWLVFYVIGISLIAYFGDNPTHGDMISTSTSFILLAILAVLTYVYGAFYAVDKKQPIVD